MKIKQFGKLAAFSLSLTVLSACTDSIDNELDDADKDESAKVTVINSIDESINFHSKVDKILRSVLDNDQRRLTLVANSSDIHRFTSDDGKGTFGIQDTNTLLNSDTLDVELKDEGSYWAIAWSDGDFYELDVVEKQQGTATSDYQVRIFSDLAAEVFVNGENLAADRLKKGEVGQSVSFTECADGLTVGNLVVDMCDHTAGQNYFIVINDGVSQAFSEN